MLIRTEKTLTCYKERLKTMLFKKNDTNDKYYDSAPDELIVPELPEIVPDSVETPTELELNTDDVEQEALSLIMAYADEAPTITEREADGEEYVPLFDETDELSPIVAPVSDDIGGGELNITEYIPDRAEPAEDTDPADGADYDEAELPLAEEPEASLTDTDKTDVEMPRRRGLFGLFKRRSKSDAGADEGSEAVEADTASVREDGGSAPDEPGAEAQNDLSLTDEVSESEEGLSDFELSIRNFSSADTESEVSVKNKKLDVIRLFVFGVCLCAFVFSTSYLVENIHDKIKSDRIYSDIIDSVADGFDVDGSSASEGGKVSLLLSDPKSSMTPTMDDIIKNGVGQVTTPSDYSAELAKMRASLESLAKINPDIYAWIKIPDTNINYPVAQTDDNEYYLDHAYNGDNLVNGSIFADFRCDSMITRNYNTVLYGHNITSGSMFNHVTEFFKPEVFDNTLIYVYTFDGIFIFKAFSIHEASFDSGYVDMGFETGDAFAAFAEKLADESDLKYDYDFTGDDRIITLSTCTNGISTQRYALHGVLVEVITD